MLYTLPHRIANPPPVIREAICGIILRDARVQRWGTVAASEHVFRLETAARLLLDGPFFLP